MKSNEIKYGNPKIMKQLREEQELNKQKQQLKDFAVNDRLEKLPNQDNLTKIDNTVTAEQVDVDLQNLSSEGKYELMSSLALGSDTEVIKGNSKKKLKSKVKGSNLKSVQVYCPDYELLNRIKVELGLKYSQTYRLALLQFSKSLDLN